LIPHALQRSAFDLPGEDPLRLEQATRENFQFIWRSLRRFGVAPDHAVDDATQRVFEIAARKRSLILPGHERAFFFKTALLVAAEARRSARRLRDQLDDGALDGALDPQPNPEQLADQAALRRMLDAVISGMPLELSTVFMLFELEELETAEIAALLEIPMGTVASRLRRARELFRERAHRLRRRLEREEHSQ
jgi:RNA polymerase sigma-70 factor (ECF subfamily)